MIKKKDLLSATIAKVIVEVAIWIIKLLIS